MFNVQCVYQAIQNHLYHTTRSHAYLGDLIAQIAKLYYTKRFQLRYILFRFCLIKTEYFFFSLRNSMP